MTFVVDRIPNDKLDEFGIVYVDAQGQKTILSSRWAKNDLEQATFVYRRAEGGGYEGTRRTEHYTLVWKGEKVEVVADPSQTTYTSSGPVMTWRVRGLRVPSDLSDKTEIIHRLIQEAFRAVGESFDGQGFAEVYVVFDLASK